MAPGQRTGIATMDADLARCSANVSSWHETDMPKYLGDVRCWVNSGKHLLSLSFSGFGPRTDIASHRAPGVRPFSLKYLRLHLGIDDN